MNDDRPLAIWLVDQWGPALVEKEIPVVMKIFDLLSFKKCEVGNRVGYHFVDDSGLVYDREKSIIYIVIPERADIGLSIALSLNLVMSPGCIMDIETPEESDEQH